MIRLATKAFGTRTEEIKEAGQIIKDGGIVAFPTETVYGLGANGLDPKAVSKVYEAKGRPSDNPMIMHISKAEDLKKLTDNITSDMKVLMEAFWPGPLTMVVTAKDIVPRVTTGGLDTVAVRMPNSQAALDLIEAAGVPLAAPSANLSGRPSPTTAMHVMDDLSGRIDGIIMGEDCQVGIESTVVDMTGDIPMILRPGIITAEQISEKLGKKVTLDPTLLMRPDIFNNDGSGEKDEEFKPKAPGMKYKHYAPNAEMIIFKGNPENVRLAMAEAKITRTQFGQKVGILIYDNSNPEEAAHSFFAQLRAFDKSDVDVILAAAMDEEGVGFSVMNRMFKSAGYNIIEV